MNTAPEKKCYNRQGRSLFAMVEIRVVKLPGKSRGSGQSHPCSCHEKGRLVATTSLQRSLLQKDDRRYQCIIHGELSAVRYL